MHKVSYRSANISSRNITIKPSRGINGNTKNDLLLGTIVIFDSIGVYIPKY